jgi:hypothetical protein
MSTTNTPDAVLDDAVVPADTSVTLAELDDPGLPCEGPTPGYEAAVVQTHGQLQDEEG